jgi:hypothetical protein
MGRLQAAAQIGRNPTVALPAPPRPASRRRTIHPCARDPAAKIALSSEARASADTGDPDGRRPASTSHLARAQSSEFATRS